MLLVSSITPSGQAWAQELASVSVPGCEFLGADTDLPGVTAPAMADSLTVAGATVISPDLVAGIASIRSVDSLVSLHTHARVSEHPVVAWFPGSVAAAATDLQAIVDLLEISGSSALDWDRLVSVRTAASAIKAGDVEIVLVCPPEESAVTRAVIEVAAAAACGLRVLGVAVCPMPRKSDGWPKAIRHAAREQVESLAQLIHPISVRSARRGLAPSFADMAADVCAPTVTATSDGQFVWSITIPGLSLCQVGIGTWTADPAYSTTHVVVDINGCVVRKGVDSTLRRCEAIDAVISGDSIAVTFQRTADQWPVDEDSEVRDG